MIPFFLFQAAGGSSARQPATMVLEFPEPHIAVLKPSPAIARTKKFSMVAVFVAALALPALVLVKMTVTRPGHEFRLGSESLQHILPMLLLFVCFGVIFLVVIMRGTSGIKRIVFDRRQGIVWKEARKLEPVWQGGLRLRDVASLELSTAPVRGMTSFALDMVMSRPQGEKVRLIAYGNREAMKANAGELARFLNVPLADRTA
jgi:hypothetical protein